MQYHSKWKSFKVDALFFSFLIRILSFHMMLDVKLLENHFQFFILASAFHMMLDVKLFENHFQLPFHRMEWIPSVIPGQGY